MDESIKQRLLKIKALADRGEDHEADNAREMLQDLLRKYGLTEADLFVYEKTDQVYDYELDWEKNLIVQIAWMVTGREKFYGQGNQKHVILRINKAERIEFEWLYGYYHDEYKKDLEAMWPAFVNRHMIFGPSASAKGAQDMDQAEIERIMNVSKGLKSRTMRRNIGKLFSGDSFFS